MGDLRDVSAAGNGASPNGDGGNHTEADLEPPETEAEKVLREEHERSELGMEGPRTEAEHLARQERRRANKEKKQAEKVAEREQRRQDAIDKHEHPGGAGAILGVRLLRFAGVQGMSLLFSNGMQLVQVVVVAHLLGPAELASYALLTFLAGLTAQVTSLFVKPGTIQGTFGGGDDDDGDDDDDDDSLVTASPRRTLGIGIIWSVILGITASLLIVVFRKPLADGLLGNPDEESLVFWSGILGGATVFFKVANIVLWLERRPKAFLLSDTSRPVLALLGLAILVSLGGGVEGAISGTALGTVVAGLWSIFLLRGSFELGWDWKEVRTITAAGRFRGPIAMSFWLIQNGDIFILSRFVEHSELGLYSLANRLGFVVSFLPQGFRVAMRPLRGSASFQAMREQYGKATASGQILGYFVLLSIFSILSMVVGGELLVSLAPPQYAAAAPLIPLTAAAFVMPALYRSVNSNVFLPNKRLYFVGGTMTAAAIFITMTWLLAPSIGVYSAPIGMLCGFGAISLFVFTKCQLSEDRIDFPYPEIRRAAALAVAVAVGFEFLPSLPTALHFIVALLLLAMYLGLLFVFRVIPEQHWRPLLHMGKSFVKGTVTMQLNPRQGLRSLTPADREQLRVAIQEGHDRKMLLAGDGALLMAHLRQAGREAGVSAIAEPSDREDEVSVFLFEEAPTAIRNASMRKLMREGFSTNDLHALEDFTTHLSKIPKAAWFDTVTNARRPGARVKRAGRKVFHRS